MTASSQERLVATRAGVRLNLPVKAGAVILQGCAVVALAGIAIDGRAATTRAELSTMLVVGLAAHSVTGGAADGDERVEIDPQIARLVNSAAGDAITAADIGKLCFLADNQTVAKTIGGGARAIAGKVIDVDADGVWVDFRDARAPRRVALPFFINQVDTLAPTNAELVSPFAGAITSMSTIVQISPTTGGDVTALVGAVAVVGLACTVANGAAKGAIVTDTPTLGDATTVVAEGSRIQIAPDAAFNTAGAVSGLLEITY